MESSFFPTKEITISDQNNPFGLPSNKTHSPTILEMKSFENDVINLIENIQFRKRGKTNFRHLWQMI